ncbi:MAG TPA: hypothetical protein VFO25_12255 [Candidatus Eremiobacteraceae bacterium]|nr:hypothetical protein [Candidatus Eremiobacteraceae bacterium]
MQEHINPIARLAFGVVGLFVAACSAGPSSTPSIGTGPRAPAFGQPALNLSAPFAAHPDVRSAFTRPAIIAVSGDTGELEAWPITMGGGSNPQPISGPLGLGFTSLAAHGNVVAIATSGPSVLLYNVATAAQTTLPDPFGSALDVAIDKNENIFVTNSTRPADTVVEYPRGDRQHPRDLSGCGLIDLSYGIAADNEGDIFVAVFTPRFAARIIEMPNGANGPEPHQCFELALKISGGYSGLAIDPKTDDLVTLDNPDECAGGIEGRMVVYPKPYEKATGKAHDLGANCSGGIRLSADSTEVFIGDQDVSGSFTFILQSSFPDGRAEGSYVTGHPDGFTTIPNTLPN